MVTDNWLQTSIVYQIFPDRFRIGNQRTIRQKIVQGLYPPNAAPKNWDELPENTHDQSLHFYGGDLAGITEKLAYIQQLGANVIYLTPFFRSNSYHKYDALDYTRIDPSLGDLAVFDELLRQAHQRNIKVIMDLVLNHLSDQHPYFQEALRHPDSKYRDYFYFTDYPHTYQCWRGYRGMPELRLEHDAVQAEFITGPASVLRFWLEKGVDGLRLDCANDVGPDICRLARETVKTINPQAVVIGEVANFAADWLRVLDGVQSYFVTVSIYSLLEQKISAAQFGANLKTLYEQSNPANALNALIMLSSHDYQRALTLLRGDLRKYALALILQFTLPGVPMIYYGEEIGMTGGPDPLNRAPMQWNETHWRPEILHLYRQMIHLRRSRAEFGQGVFLELSNWLNNGVVAYLRHVAADPKQCALVLINPTAEKKAFRLFAPLSYLISDVILEDIFTKKRIKNIDSYLDIEIEALTGAVYIPDYLYQDNYSFYKRL